MSSADAIEEPKQPADGQGTPSYQCKFCKKTFARAEHLTRHERSRNCLAGERFRAERLGGALLGINA